ncbi:MAG: ATP-binding cassette domain-containing protein [Thermodesulfobacteriota bacterium]
MLKVQSITKVFHRGEINEVTALQDASLDVPAGQVVVLIGGNGSGKSTLLNLVAGTYLPDSGRIVIGEHDMTHVPEHGRAGILGRVFQDPLVGTASGLTIEENFALAASRGAFRGLRLALGRKLRDEIRDRLATLGMGLEGRMRTKVGLLSGGQRQAISILMAVCKQPLVLLLDEHTAALDPRASRQIMDLTRTIIREHNLTTIMVTHNLNHALENGDRTIVMSRGRIVHEIPRQQLDTMTIDDLFALFHDAQLTAAV